MYFNLIKNFFLSSEALSVFIYLRSKTLVVKDLKKGKTMRNSLKIEGQVKTYLHEDELPKAWYNVRADMKKKPAPLLNPGTGKPVTFEDLQPVFCDELIKQELDNDTAYIEIPEDIRTFYKMYRPSPLVRAYFLEQALGTPAHIYYKFEGNNTSGSHKLNSAIAQAYFAFFLVCMVHKFLM